MEEGRQESRGSKGVGSSQVHVVRTVRVIARIGDLVSERESERGRVCERGWAELGWLG